jgi:hypothetical protein
MKDCQLLLLHEFEIKTTGLKRTILTSEHFLWPGNQVKRNLCLFSHRIGCRQGC